MKKAFTLAEVLITLTIVGVIAAITIPNLMTKYQKHVTVTKFKKAYVELNQALKLAESTQGDNTTWDLSNFNSFHERNTYFFNNYLAPNLKIAESCPTPTTKCWAQTAYTIDKKLIALNDKSISYSFKTVSGYSVYFWLHENGLGGWFYVDINGQKEPNILGKDIFPLSAYWGNSYKRLDLRPTGIGTEGITREKLINGNLENFDPMVMNKSGCKKGSQEKYAGLLCGALIMLDGWQIKDDYPW